MKDKFFEDSNFYKKHYYAGEKQLEGFYVCSNCGQKLYLNDGDILIECPKCTNRFFTKG